MSSLPQFSFSSAEMKRIRRVQFGVVNPEEMKAMSVVEVTKPGTHNAGVPIRNGLNDPAMGACDLRTTCSTCKNTYSGTGKVNDCPGHFGHIELASPVWHIGFLPVLYKLMQCVCINCSRLLVDKNSLDFQRAAQISNGKKRLMALLRLCRGRRQCKGNSGAEATNPDGSSNGVTTINESDVGCGAYQPNFRREGLKISIEYKEEHVAELNVADRKQVLTPEKAYSILRNVSNEDVRILGLNPRYARPEWMIVTVMPVAPPHVRPSVAVGGGATRSDDDVTHKYADILKANITVSNAKKSGQPAVVVQQYEAVLQYHVATLVDNSIPGLPNATQRGGKQLKTFRERLVGKMGRVRGNLMGKRVDFSARTVITADPNLSIHQVGVPRSIAANLTVPERVNRYNIRRLQTLVERGPHEHPGCKYIIRDNGMRIDLRHAKSANDLTLKYGYIVERHLMDDDTVLFNRQPTLHKMSIMCHKAKVLDYSTFRLNLTCTTPYNADFDGDEMNMHALQTLPAIAEASELMIVPRLIITAQANRPVMGIVQDTLLGSRLFTYRDVFVPMDVLMCAVMWMISWDGKLPQPAIMKPVKGKPGKHVPLWTGKQIFSMFIPEVNYSTGAMRVKDSRDDLWAQDGQVLIEKGQLLMGMLDKNSLGNKGGSLLHVIMNDVSPEDCRDFINTTQRVVNYWLLHRGFSIGIGDAEAPTATMMQVSRSINEAKDKVKGILQKAQLSNGLQRQPGQTMMMSFEALVNEVLNRARDQASNAVTQVLDERSNAVLTMVAAGSKGSDNNISQIIACVAQQNIDGSRIGYGFRDRTLPHFTKFDLGPIARGFVENSYLKGLTPSEFFFHTMAGRVGLIDTAVKTAETGYIQRRLVKAMEDAMVRYDGTVRNSCNEVVQFLYGEDGMDARWIENNEFPSYKCSMGELKERYEWNPDHPSFGRAGPNRELFLDPNVQEDMRLNLETRDELAKEFEMVQKDRRLLVDAFQMSKTMDKDVTPMPLAVSRMILNVKRRFRISSDKGGTTDMHPVKDVIQPLNALLERLVIVPGTDRLAREAQDNATSMLRVLLRSQLASKRVMQFHRLTKEAFRTLLGEIETRFNISVAAAGEMCGVLAAQSLGEPATQMTLNTFHHAGVSAKNVTLGMPRLKELINIAKNIRTPSLTIFVNSELRQDEALALDRLQQVLEYITLHDLVEETRILYDPDTTTTVIEEDRLFVETYALAPDEGINLENLSPWVLRLRLSRERMGNRLIRIDEVKAKVKAVDPTLDVIDNGVNDPIPVLRIRISNATRAVAAEAEEDAEAAAAREAAGSTGDEDEKTLRDFEQYLLHDLPLRGIPGVKKLFKGDHKAHTWTQEQGVKPAPKEPKFETEGSNLLRVLNLPEVDHTRTFCNDVIEILLVLGIEACRQSLLNELRAVISFDGTYVNYRHMALLVDTMTFRGSLTAVTRHGINRVDSGPLIRSSFEETCEILMEAAAFAEVDEMRGASSNIMLGQMAPIGTGHCDILMDEDKLQEAIPVDIVTQELVTGGSGAGMGLEGSGSVYINSATPMLASSPTDIVGGGPGSGMSPYSQSVYGATGMTPGGPQFSPTSWTPQGGAGGIGGAGSFTPASFSPGAGLGTGGYGSGALSPGAGLGSGGMSPSQYAMAYTGGYQGYGGPQSPAYGGAGGAGAGGGGAGGYYGVQSPAFSGASDDLNSEYSPNTGPSMTPMGSSMGLSMGMSPATSYGLTSTSGGGMSGSVYTGMTGMSSAMQSQSQYSGSGGAAGGPGAAGFSPASPYYSPTSPGLGLASSSGAARGAGGPGAAAAGAAAGFSSQYSPTSPGFSPASGGANSYPGGGAGGAKIGASPAYSPTSPAFSPAGGAGGGMGGGAAAGMPGGAVSRSPAYSPTSPAFSPASGPSSAAASIPGGASVSGGAAGYSPTSPGYSPSAPAPGGNSSSSSSSGNNGGYSPQK